MAVAAAVLSVLWASRRRGARDQVPMGTMQRKGKGLWFQPLYRAKPGQKFKHLVHKDWICGPAGAAYCHPEFGLPPPTEKGRIMKWGMILRKGEYWPAFSAGVGGHDEAITSAIGGEVVGALLLDCDGTLVETERDGHRVSFNQAFKEKGFNFEWDVALYGELLKTAGGKERMTRYFTDFNSGAWTAADPPSKDHPLIKELHELKTKLFMDIVRSGALPLREGIEDMISAASNAGWKLAVCSTSNEESVKAVVQTMLPQFSDQISIFAGDMVAKKKPSPDIYKMAAKALGVAPMKCVVVEDTAIGVQAGKAAGMSVIVTKSIYSAEEDFDGADLVVDSAAELQWSSIESLLPVLQLS